MPTVSAVLVCSLIQLSVVQLAVCRGGLEADRHAGELSPIAVIIIIVWQWVPFMMLILLAGRNLFRMS
jgi:ABC-type spermidine/putrescine transport system permease subunit I